MTISKSCLKFLWWWRHTPIDEFISQNFENVQSFVRIRWKLTKSETQNLTIFWKITAKGTSVVPLPHTFLCKKMVSKQVRGEPLYFFELAMHSFWTKFGVLNQVAWLIFCLLYTVKKWKKFKKIGKVRHRYNTPIASDPAARSLFFEARLERQRKGSLEPRLLPLFSSLSAIAKYIACGQSWVSQNWERIKRIPYWTDEFGSSIKVKRQTTKMYKNVSCIKDWEIHICK